MLWKINSKRNTKGLERKLNEMEARKEEYGKEKNNKLKKRKKEVKIRN
jgi:hypothetical protein